MNTNVQSWKDYVPQSVSLYNVDYRENLDEHEELQEKCIRQNDLMPLTEEVLEWYMEQEANNWNQLLDEIRKKMERDGKLHEYEEHLDEMGDLFYERNDTDPTDGLIRNSRPTNMFYSLGVKIEGYADGTSNREESNAISYNKIRRALKLKKSQFDDQLTELVDNATYGGELRIYFNAMFDDLLTSNKKRDFKTIRFHGDVIVAVADSHNGSGYHVELPLDITLPFNRDNLFVDSQVHYSYANEICGMCNDWCDSTKWQTGMEPVKASIPKSTMSEHQQKEARYEKTFREGGCTFGDMNYNRHRDTYYIYSFPCGNKCPHCGTFWID